MVIVRIIIADDGSVRDAQVVKSVAGLDQAALDAVLQWEFMPTLLNGEPVEVEMTKKGRTVKVRPRCWGTG